MKLSLKKFIALAAGVAAVLSVLTVLALVSALRHSAQADAAAARRYSSYLLADELRQSSDDLTRLARTYVVSGGEPKWEQQYFEILDIRGGKKPRPDHYERVYWDFRAADAAPPTRPGARDGAPLKASASGETIALLDLMKRNGFSDAEFAKLEEAKANSDGLVKTETIAMELVKQHREGKGNPATAEADRAKARELMHDANYHREKAKIMNPVNDFLTLLDARTRAETEAAIGQFNRWLYAGVTLLGLLLVTVLGSLVAIRSRTLKLLASVGSVVGGIAEGQLDQAVPAGDASEEGRLYDALSTMQQHLAGIVSTIRSGADSVATASSQISQGNNDLSQRTEQQATSLQQTAASMQQLGSTVRHNADSARQADQLAQGASSVASRGGDVVGQVVETMRGINEASNRIADITGVIDSIAFQTNILALNAAVEAARAGEQGRGFAVVAGEVRSLAQRSAAAAKEIKELITDSVGRVGRGTELADQAGDTMREIVHSIQRVTDIMSEITNASAEQSQGVALVGQSITEMDRTTQQNAALVEESAAAAESLRQQAEQLVASVSVFKLGASAAS